MSHWASLIEPAKAIPASLVPVLRAPSLADDEPPKAAPKKPKRAMTPKRQQTWDEHLQARWEGSLRQRMALMLVDGAMERGEFGKQAKRACDALGMTGENAVAHAFNRMRHDGLVVCEVKLTAKGRKKLGLKGGEK